ncbi:hypothetical protein [Burkholderia sp. BCC0405]|uniref:hypothetical protein n=1 Tax=Burkholderia sp. BCC0405 TaxID=2676298 RepID=UPI00158AE10A|nr:hypothetical protein [Burkholderia sp. BCC0405]
MVSDCRGRHPEESPGACLERQLPFACERICRIAAVAQAKRQIDQDTVTFVVA